MEEEDKFDGAFAEWDADCPKEGRQNSTVLFVYFFCNTKADVNSVEHAARVSLSGSYAPTMLGPADGRDTVYLLIKNGTVFSSRPRPSELGRPSPIGLAALIGPASLELSA